VSEASAVLKWEAARAWVRSGTCTGNEDIGELIDAGNALRAEVERLEGELRRTQDYIEAHFDVLTAEEIGNLARAKGVDVAAEAEKVRDIFRRAYERVTGQQSAAAPAEGAGEDLAKSLTAPRPYGNSATVTYPLGVLDEGEGGEE
jgi:hypothetical protein